MYTPDIGIYVHIYRHTQQQGADSKPPVVVYAYSVVKEPNFTASPCLREQLEENQREISTA